MNVMTPIYTKQVRLAQHYLGKLREASRAYQSGDENTTYGLNLAGQDWPQIQQWQAWTVIHAEQREATELSSAYPFEAGDLLELMLTPQEHRRWRESALAAAQQLEDVQAQIAHLLALGQIHYSLDEYARAINYTQQALILARQADDQRSIAHGLATLGRITHLQGKYAEALAYHEQSLALYRQLQDQAGIARNLLGMAQIMNNSGKHEAMRPYVEESLQIFRQLGDLRSTGLALRELAISCSESESALEALSIDEAYSILKRVGNQSDLVELYVTLHLSLEHRQDYAQALVIAEEGLRLARQLDRPIRVSSFLINLAYAESNQGSFEAARLKYLEALSIARQIGSLWQMSVILSSLSELASVSREYQQALTYAAEALTIERQHRHPVFLPLALCLETFAHLALGNLKDGLSDLAEIGSIVRMTSDPDLSAHLLTLTAFLKLKQNQAASSAALLGLLEGRPVNQNAYQQIKEALRSTLGAEAFSAAFERGKSLDFNSTVAQIIAELSE